jgi:tRNA G10  N-methylase Trm11
MDNKYQEKLNAANKQMQNAEYLLDRTYKLAKDPKILISVLAKVNEAFNLTITALIYRDREVKIISNFHDSEKSRMDIFVRKCVKRYNFDKSIIVTINELKEILREHKNSSVEFSRNKEFVICNDNFKFKKININDTKEFLDNAKDFIYKIEKIIQLNKFKA